MTEAELESLLIKNGLQGIRIGNGNIHACCPDHNETRPSWGISTDWPHFHACFACGFKGTLFTLLVSAFGKSPAEAERIVGVKRIKPEDFSLTPVPKSQAPTKAQDEEVLMAYALEPAGTNYMLRRGITLETIFAAGLLFHRPDKRVLFPWYENDIFLGATGRTVIGDLAKIITYFDLKKGVSFYAPARYLTPQAPIVLVEGETDALKVFQSGYQNVAALSFAKFTQTQERKLLTLDPSEVILYFDNDEAGRTLTEAVTKRLLGKVRKLTKVNYEKFTSKLDPGGSSEADNIMRILHRIPAGISFRL